MRATLISALAALLCLGCGSSTNAGGSGSGAPDGGQGSGGSDGGNVPADGGAGADGGTVGSDGGGGVADAGMGGGGGSEDAGTAAEAGTGQGGGGSDAGTTSDAGVADGGTASDDCEGLRPPPLGAPIGVEIGISKYGSCFTGTSDGSGNVALPRALNGQALPETIAVALYDRNGTALGSYQGDDLALFEALAGYLVTDSDMFTQSVAAVDPSGHQTAVTARQELGPASIDPVGGLVVLVRAHDSDRAVEVVNYDDQLNERWRVAVPTTGFALAVGADRLGRALVVATGAPAFGADAITAAWIDTDATAGKEFLVATDKIYSNVMAVFPRVGSGVFVRDPSGNWIAQIDSLAAQASPAPDWLASRPSTALHGAHDGTAYALIYHPTTTSCDQKIEVFTASGKSCGAADFGCGQPGPLGGIAVGYDGTVIQNVAPTGTYQNGDGACRWQFWPGFLH